jgi:hypothetical protein
MFDPKGIAMVSAAVILFGGGLYFTGYSNGETHARLETALEAEATAKKVTDLQHELMAASATHSREMQEIYNDYAQESQKHALALDAISVDANNRLQLSKARADVYQRQARSSSAEQERLAKHAAELDRTIEEGRSLVRELREAVGQRDAAIRALGSMITTDRKLFSTSN